MLRADLSGDPSFRELLGRVRETALGAYAHQDLPFEMLVEDAPARSATQPLATVPGDVHPPERARREIPTIAGLTLALAGAVDNGTSKFDLTLTMMEGVDGLTGHGRVQHRPVRGGHRRAPAGPLPDPARGGRRRPGPAALPAALLTAAERQQLLAAWNRTGADYPPASCIHELFEAQAARTPDAVAVVCGGEQPDLPRTEPRGPTGWRTTCAALGVGPEVLVGLCMERSLDLVVGLLGVLKAGGAYVPARPGATRASAWPPSLEDARAPGAADPARPGRRPAPRRRPAPLPGRRGAEGRRRRRRPRPVGHRPTTWRT